MPERYLIIEDIDKPLYKYGMIYKQDLNNYFTENIYLKLKHKLKCMAITGFLTLSALKFAVSLKLLENGKIHDYCFDIVQHVGGIVIYFLTLGFLIALMTAGFNYEFNTANESIMKWLEIIQVLKGVSSVKVLKIPERNEVIKFFLNTGTLYKALKLSFCFLITFSIMICPTIIIFNYDFYRAISFGLISLMLILLYCYYSVALIHYCLMYFLIICYYCKLRMNSINKNLNYLIEKFMISNKSIDNLLKDHNDLCNAIYDYNIFWKRIYKYCLYGIIPINLIFLHQVFFGELRLQILLGFIIAVISYLSLLLILNFITASVHKEVSKSYKLLHLLYLKISSTHMIKRKIKVIFKLIFLIQK
jgi:hypothetical protein